VNRTTSCGDMASCNFSTMVAALFDAAAQEPLGISG